MQFDFEKYAVCHVAELKGSYYKLALYPGYQQGFIDRTFDWFLDTPRGYRTAHS